jgi:hypothetical protein
MAIWHSQQTQRIMAILCVMTLMFYSSSLVAQQAPVSGQQFSAEQLQSLVAPIALYPDPLLSQVLVASTYPLEIVECARWFQQNSNLHGKDLAAAVGKQRWDASVQGLVTFPDVLQKLNANISWTTDLGNAFLAQQADVMQAVQTMRKKAEQSGKLETTPQQTVSSASGYVEIQPANPDVIYVPQYNPEYVWGAPADYYPYPAMAYPSYSGGAVAASVISFAAGVAIGSMWSGGGWGWNAGWGHNAVVINNNFINNNRFNRVNVANGNVWQHNAIHRGGVPYADRAVGNRYNGVGVNPVNRPTVSQTEQRLGQASRQAGVPAMGQRQMNPGQRNLQPSQLGGKPNGSANRAIPNAGAAGDRMGNRQVNGGNFGSAGRSAFGDMNGGGGRANMNMNRGMSSGGGFRGGGGGGFRGGGGFGGGGRGGGGRRR